MSQGTFQSINKIGEENFNQSVTITTKSQHITDINVPAAKVGSLTTRTSATVGTLTMTAGHGLTTTQSVDLYWDGGSRKRVVTGAVTGNSVPFAEGTGDDLPSANTSINVGPVIFAPVSIETDAIKALAISSAGRGTVRINGQDDYLITKAFDAAGIYSWFEGSGVTKPIASTTRTEEIEVSNGEVSSKKLRVAFLHD